MSADQDPYQPPEGYELKKKRSFWRRHKIFTGLLTIVAVVIVIAAVNSIGGGGGNQPTTKEPVAAGGGQSQQKTGGEKKEKKEPKLHGIGDPVSDGNFTFTVTDVEETDTLGDPEFLGSEAQGKYVIVDLDVENTGDESATFNAGPSQVAYDKAGNEYETTPDQMMTDDSSFLEPINPGNSVEGRLVYDVPEDTELVRVHLQGGTFSQGAEVSLK